MLFVENSTDIIETTCVIPINAYAEVVWYVDMGEYNLQIPLSMITHAIIVTSNS